MKLPKILADFVAFFAAPRFEPSGPSWIKEREQISLIEVGERDTVVIRYPKLLTAQQREKLVASLAGRFPSQAKIVVLEDGASLDVLRAPEIRVMGEFGASIQQFVKEANKLASDVCTETPPGWFCTRAAGHDGPCAAIRNDDDAGKRPNPIPQPEPDSKRRARSMELRADDESVNYFAKKMKGVMTEKGAQGKSGWRRSSESTLLAGLRRNAQEGDWISVANYAMMLDGLGFTGRGVGL